MQGLKDFIVLANTAGMVSMNYESVNVLEVYRHMDQVCKLHDYTAMYNWFRSNEPKIKTLLVVVTNEFEQQGD